MKFTELLQTRSRLESEHDSACEWLAEEPNDKYVEARCLEIYENLCLVNEAIRLEIELEQTDQ